MLEFDVSDSPDHRMQIITTLQSTPSGKKMYTDLCERLSLLEELVSRILPYPLKPSLGLAKPVIFYNVVCFNLLCANGAKLRHRKITMQATVAFKVCLLKAVDVRESAIFPVNALVNRVVNEKTIFH